jgi:hypothetical protein
MSVGTKGLPSAQQSLLLAILIRNETVFNEFRWRLTVSHFDALPHQLLYRLVLSYVDECDRLPTEPELWSELLSSIEEEPDLLSDEEKEELELLFDFIFNEATYGGEDVCGDKLTQHAFKVAKKLLQSRHLSEMQQELHRVTDLSSLSGLFSQAQSVCDDISLAEYSRQANLFFNEGWDRFNHGIITSTGVPFLDQLMNGGTKKREVYLLMAPYGSFKTTLGVMLLCAGAKSGYEETLVPGWEGRKGLYFYVSYEASQQPELQHRALMYAAQIERNRLEAMQASGIGYMSDDPNSPLPYERSLFRQLISDGMFIPERTRITRAIEYLNAHAVCIDLSGVDPNFPRAGHGGIPEIVSRIKLEIRNRGGFDKYYVRGVIVDYLGVLVSNQDSSVTRKGGGKDKEDHKVLQESVNNIAREISKKMDTHVWVLHQLSGQANAVRSPTKQLHHTDGKGSKSVAENADFAMVGSALTQDHLGQLWCTKHRRHRRHPPVIVRVDGNFNSVVNPSNYHVDSRGRIVDREMAMSSDAGQLPDTLRSVEAAVAGNIPVESGEAEDEFGSDDVNVSTGDRDDADLENAAEFT